MTTEQRAKIRLRIWKVLTVVAFGLSYFHGVAWVQEHLAQKDQRTAYAIALLPEALVIVVLLSLPERKRDPRVWITGVYAVSWTMYANGAMAQNGLSGLVIALSPAIAALLSLWLVGHGTTDAEPVELALSADPEPEQTTDKPADELAQIRLTKAARAGDQGGSEPGSELALTPGVQKALAWIRDQPNSPTIKETVKGSGVSAATVKRARRLLSVTVDTDGTKSDSIQDV